MASILKRSNKKGEAFSVTVRVAGFAAKRATFQKLKDAKAWAAEEESRLRLGKKLPELAAKDFPFGKLVERYLAALPAVLSAKKAATRQKHIDTKRLHLFWWLAQIGSAVSLSNITPALIAEKKTILLSVRKLSPATVNRYVASLSHCLETAVTEWNVLSHSPLAKSKRLTESKGRVRFLSEEERHALLAACSRIDSKPLYLIVVMAISTGARKSELLTMRWEDVDLQRGMITLHDTKNGERRAVFVRGHALELLKDQYAARIRGRRFVFTSRFRDRPCEIEREWRRARAAAKLKNFRFHDLRHTTASYLAQNSATPMDIAVVLGHMNLEMVKRYTHLTESHIGSVVERMNNHIFENTGVENGEA